MEENKTPDNELYKEYLKLTQKDYAEREIKIIPFSEMIKGEDQPTKWIIKPLIAEGSLTYIGSAPKSYKSFIAIHMALAIARGENFLESSEFPTERKNVLYIDEENGEKRIKKRVKQIIKRNNKYTNTKNIYFAPKQLIKLDKEGTKIIIDLVKKYNIGCIIFDSLVRFIEGDEDRSTDIRKTYDKIKEIQQKNNTSIVALHHLTKSANSKKNKSTIHMNDLRGSGDIAAMADSIIGLSKIENELEKRVILQIIESRDAPVDGLKWLINIEGSDEKQFIKMKVLGKIIKEKKAKKTKKDNALEYLKEKLSERENKKITTKEINEILGKKDYKKNTVYDTIKLAKETFLEQKDKGIYLIKEIKKPPKQTSF